MKELIRGSVSYLDRIAWLLTLTFFCGGALLSDGDILNSFLGAAGVIMLMIIVNLSVDILIESIRHVRSLGTIVGFITNIPEALCLVVGLMAGDVLFAASTPLGSNVMNPVLFLVAVLWLRNTTLLLGQAQRYMYGALGISVVLAISFMLIPEKTYPTWILIALVLTIFLFIKRPDDIDTQKTHVSDYPAWYALPSALLLCGAGYMLDPVIGYASDSAKISKAGIGFFALAFLTSWPEFRSALALLTRGRTMSAKLNIIVSNITNLWLAIVGITIFMYSRL